MKYESGAHRVQRVPATESMGRIHTSTSTVLVMPEATEIDFKLDPNDLKMIPQYFLNFFEENMDKSYEVTIQENKPLYEQDLREETKAFIKILYITYFSDNKEEKERLMEEFKVNLPKLPVYSYSRKHANGYS